MMIPYLFHIGSFYFNLYGFCIALGMLAFVWAASKDPLAKKYFKGDELTHVVLFCLVVGLVGSRIVNIIQYRDAYASVYEFFAIWEGGLSLMGAVIPIILILPFYLRYKKISIVPLFDLAGVYGPLLQSIARWGCFFAGCCNGCQTNVPWAITYTHPDTHAFPTHVPIHPSQLYSSLMLFVIFLIMYFLGRKFLKKPGQLFGAYLLLSSLERFLNDFFRAEHYQEHLVYGIMTQNQLLALCTIGAGLMIMVIASVLNTKKYEFS